MPVNDPTSLAIYNELKSGSLLVGDLPDAPSFDRSHFSRSHPSATLNLNQKLGHLYEEALANLIQTAPKLDLIARSVQIFDATGRTLGELDFLVYDHVAKKHIHLELAVKFYLGIQLAGDWHFPGPDARDNWHRKLERMRSHQLRLSQTDEAKATLEGRFNIQEIETQQLIYGRLFDPIDNQERPILDNMNTHARRGKWLYLRDWRRNFDDNAKVTIISKHMWPVSLSAKNRQLNESTSAEGLKSATGRNCIMFAIEDSQEPFFLVPNDWLATK